MIIKGEIKMSKAKEAKAEKLTSRVFKVTMPEDKWSGFSFNLKPYAKFEELTEYLSAITAALASSAMLKSKAAEAGQQEDNDEESIF